MDSCKAGHRWAIPELGAIAIICETCGRARGVLETVSPELIARIVAERAREAGGDITPGVSV